MYLNWFSFLVLFVFTVHKIHRTISVLLLHKHKLCKLVLFILHLCAQGVEGAVDTSKVPKEGVL